jgi:tetratricopeptide (TPR) repeat protein
VLGNALVDQAQWESAAAVLTEAKERADAQGMPGVAAEAMVAHAYVELHTLPDTSQAHTAAELEKAMQLFEQAGDERGLAHAMTEAGRLPYWRGETELAIERFELAASHARAAGDASQELAALGGLVSAMIDGSTPVVTALARVEEMARLTTGASRTDVTVRLARAELERALGHHDAATSLADTAGEIAEDLGLTMSLHTGVARIRGRTALAGGDPQGAESVFRAACNALDDMGDVGHLVSMLPFLADSLYVLGRIEEIADDIDRLIDVPIDDDLDGLVGMRRARSKLLASRGELPAAERVLREGLDHIERTDFLPAHCDVLTDLAELLALSGRHDEAAEALETAVTLYERKGAIGLVEETRARLEDLRQSR